MVSALAQADPDHSAAVYVRRHGDLARADPKPLAGRHRLRRRSARRGGRLPARAWIADMDGWRSALIAVGAIGAAAAVCFRAAWRGSSRCCTMSRAFGQPLVRCCGILRAGCSCSDRFGGLVQQLDPAARNRAHAGQGSAGDSTARRAAMELVLSRQGRARDHRPPAMWGPSPQHAAGGRCRSGQ